jgi:hypothetical protein
MTPRLALRTLLLSTSLWRSPNWRAGAALGASFAAAGILALALSRPDPLPPARRGVHGGEVAIELVGEKAGARATHFGQRERFKLLVRCPPDLTGSLRAVVYQDDAIYMPLSDGGPVTCGNRSPWPGAFALDGDAPAHVCVRWDGRSWPASKAVLRGDMVCATLKPRR